MVWGLGFDQKPETLCIIDALHKSILCYMYSSLLILKTWYSVRAGDKVWINGRRLFLGQSSPAAVLNSQADQNSVQSSSPEVQLKPAK